ncbi:MAG: putative S-layer protein [Nanoarchaeota archaeon]|nr:putative S-layer protein [Nanoarchaeota archaeon]
MNNKLVLGLVLALFVLVMGASAQTLTVSSVTAAAGNPGANVDVTVNVRNSGAANISSVLLTSTALSFNSNSITAPAIESITNLAAGTEQTKTFTIALPSLPAGFYNATITATDAANANEAATKTYGVTINPVSSFEIAQAKARISAQSNDVKSTTFTIRNTGSVTLAPFVFSYNGTFSDNDDDMITLSFSSLASLAPGATADVTLTADIERNVDLGTYTGTITARANSVTRTLPIEVEVEPNICKQGTRGKLTIYIKDPSSGDTYTPGETMDIQVRVGNDYSRKLNVNVEAVLYDATDNKKIAKIISDSRDIKDGDDKTFNMALDIPSGDLDEDNTYYLYVKAYKTTGEEKHCAYDRVEVEIEREDEMVVIVGFSLTKTDFSCTDTVTATVTVENTGLEDQDDVSIALESSSLGINMESKKFRVNAYDENGNRHTESFVFNVGNAGEGDYRLIATVYYGNNEQETKDIIVRVSACDIEAKKLMGEARLLLSMKNEKLALPYTAKKFVLPLIVENKGGKAASFTIDATEISGWAEVTATEAPSSLNAGEQYHVYIYMQLKDNVASGAHNFRINLRNGDALLYSKLASVTIAEAPVIEEAAEGAVDVGSVSAWLFSDKQRLFWIAGDLVLVILALVFLKLLLRR